MLPQLTPVREWHLTIVISGRTPTFTARRGRKISVCAFGAPHMLCHGPL